MNTVTVRNVTIGEGMPKICIPIVDRRADAVWCSAAQAAELPADLVEWRADWFDDVLDPAAASRVLAGLREKLGEIPLLMTFRTAQEGGMKAISPEAYARLYIDAMATGCVDMIDAELFMGEAVLHELIEKAHACGVKVIMSNHDFQQTPAKAEIIRRLICMQDAGADLLKIAVMPACRADVLTLLDATREMYENLARQPVITMAMGRLGMISRVAGEAFGSAVTFGSAGRTSAPGQMEARQLKQVLVALHAE